MKANKIAMDRRAQVGIGTLIIFIAMVLVAAVAAAVLIQTSGVLQQKAQTTGKEATKEVSSNLDVDSIEGWRGGTQSSASKTDTFSNELYRLDLRCSLKVGSEPVDMNQAVITITDGTTTNDLRYIEGDLITACAVTGAGKGTYTASASGNGITNTTYRFMIDGTSHTDAMNILKNVYPDTNMADGFVAKDSDATASNVTCSYTTPYVWSQPSDTGYIIALDAGAFRFSGTGNYTEIRDGTYHTAANTTQNKYLMRGDMFYIVDEIRDEDKSFTKDNPVMNTGDLVKVIILTGPKALTTAAGEEYETGEPSLTNNYPFVGEANLELKPRTSVTVSMIPEGGAGTTIDFVAPSSYGTNANVDLYP